MGALYGVSGPGAGRQMRKWPAEVFYITLEMYSLALCESFWKIWEEYFFLGTNIKLSTEFFTTISNSSKFVFTNQQSSAGLS